ALGERGKRGRQRHPEEVASAEGHGFSAQESFKSQIISGVARQVVLESRGYQGVACSFQVRQQTALQLSLNRRYGRRVDEIREFSRVFAKIVQLIDAGGVEAVFMVRRADGADAEPEPVVPFVSVERLVRSVPTVVAVFDQRAQRAAVYIGDVRLQAGPLDYSLVDISAMHMSGDYTRARAGPADQQ